MSAGQSGNPSSPHTYLNCTATFPTKVKLWIHKFIFIDKVLISLGSSFAAKREWLSSFYGSQNSSLPALADDTFVEEQLNELLLRGIGDMRNMVKGYFHLLKTFEGSLILYPFFITISVFLCCVVLVRKFRLKDCLGVLDGEDIDTQYMVSANGGVVKEEVGTQVKLN